MDKTYRFTPLTRNEALDVLRWRYEGEYAIYNPLDDSTEEDVAYLLNPAYACHAVWMGSELVGFCGFFEDGQVSGGDYSEEALDIGAGRRPDLTGQGDGAEFLAAVLDFAKGEFRPKQFRVTIAQFNTRAQHLCHKLGFTQQQIFTRGGTKVKRYIVLTRPA